MALRMLHVYTYSYSRPGLHRGPGPGHLRPVGCLLHPGQLSPSCASLTGNAAEAQLRHAATASSRTPLSMPTQPMPPQSHMPDEPPPGVSAATPAWPMPGPSSPRLNQLHFRCSPNPRHESDAEHKSSSSTWSIQGMKWPCKMKCHCQNSQPLPQLLMSLADHNTVHRRSTPSTAHSAHSPLPCSIIHRRPLPRCQRRWHDKHFPP
jgi:hypothetical protein